VPNVCQNANATISASAAGAIGWSWTGPNNFTGNTATVTLNNIQPPSQGAYFATATFAIGTVSCTTQNSAVQNVVPVNPINVIPQISQCEPANISLQANSAGAATYSWTGPNSYTSNVSNPQMYGLLPNASGVYTVTTSYNNGNLICYNTNTTNVTINPKLNFTLTPYTLGCFNSLLNVNGPAGATSYTWTGSSGFTSNTQNLNIPFVQANQSGIYTLEVMLGPCKTSGSTRVDILDPLKFDKTPTNKTICRGEAVTFTMQSVGGSGNYAYVWNPPLYVGSPTGSVQSGNPLGTTIYNVTGYDIACPNYTINHTFTLTVNQPPQPNLNLEKVSGCQPLCLLYNSKTQSEASTTTYDFGNGIKFQADSIRYCIDVPGVYNLKIHSTGNNGCKGTYDYPLPITVYPKPGSSINHNPEYIILSDNQVVFNPSHQAGPIVSTNWIFLGTKESMNGQIDSSGIRNPERVFETAGKYPVMLVSTTDKGCVDSVVKFIEVNEDFSVYIPNTFTPNGDGVNDVFMVKGTGMKIENYTMEIFDRWGTMLYSSKDITKGWDGSAKGAQLPIGAYIYKVKVIGANGQGKKEYVGHVTLMK
jgi:gliding motility-associated-like protein